LSEGPYRDLGSGFARLMGGEGVRRAPSHVETVEVALLELVRNAVDADAENVYVASALHARRYRELVVLDDGSGVPEPYQEMIFEPGVTTRHLAPSRGADQTHGAGLSLHHIREAALSAAMLSTASPTSIRTIFDTEALPERALQSAGNSNSHGGPRSNLRSTLQRLAEPPGSPEIFYGSPASILALLLNKRIIPRETGELERWCGETMGVELSRRTLQRVLKGQVTPAGRVGAMERREEPEKRSRGSGGELVGGGRLELDERDLSEVRSVIERAARESYLEVGEIGFGSRDGEITIRAEIYEVEEEYDE
jgi:hypothetical protein